MRAIMAKAQAKIASKPAPKKAAPVKAVKAAKPVKVVKSAEPVEEKVEAPAPAPKAAKPAKKGKDKLNIGIEQDRRAEIIESVSKVLADTYVLYLKTHAFHWNVHGPYFNSLHLMFETQYNELWAAVDPLAERIRSLGGVAPWSYGVFQSLATIQEATNVPDAMKMVRELLDGHETLVRNLREGLAKLDGVADQATEDLLTQRLQVHEKTAWMLRATLN
jgi:starvation-inducible DNA-binding protein